MKNAVIYYEDDDWAHSRGNANYKKLVVYYVFSYIFILIRLHETNSANIYVLYSFNLYLSLVI